MPLCCCGLCWADTIVLKEGQSLTGNILAEKDTQLIVDIGVAVLTIPKENILEYEYTKTLEQNHKNCKSVRFAISKTDMERPLSSPKI